MQQGRTANAIEGEGGVGVDAIVLVQRFDALPARLSTSLDSAYANGSPASAGPAALQELPCFVSDGPGRPIQGRRLLSTMSTVPWDCLPRHPLRPTTCLADVVDGGNEMKGTSPCWPCWPRCAAGTAAEGGERDQGIWRLMRCRGLHRPQRAHCRLATGTLVGRESLNVPIHLFCAPFVIPHCYYCRVSASSPQSLTDKLRCRGLSRRLPVPVLHHPSPSHRSAL
ncbi:hypothetical protein EJ04DRAFT_149714 [Polyplosphaeria fusca]|uniref:Uncharacterized protein n=1 Tax=Polyplosphaeria fusca TaxID=682080 RepID=A0A9P4R004_9PLEO|nr:hypothetical protein EJ04DRAFT_149714 [Polyplosphaeria fusca]